jgi:hypothetical protein
LRAAHRLALAIGCTVAELRTRMGSREFGQWQAFFAEEPVGPADNLALWASLMAALHNGPLVKRSKQPWTAADFLPRMWQPPPEPKKAGIADLRAHVAALKAAKASAKK